MDPYSRHYWRNRDFVLGLIVLAIGTILLLGNLEAFSIESIWGYWPFILVAIGVGKIVAAVNARDFGGGVWWIFIGLWLYVSIEHIFGLGFSRTWPALIIACGIAVLWKELVVRRGGRIAGEVRHGS